ncbi:MAG: transporter permease, partial [Thermomicrobiales bacterium]|nr:transporter permease [Thermomicrobiales bacterium]
MVLLYALTVLILVIIAFPIYWLITTSIKVPAETATAPPVIVPTRFTLDNYRAALATPGVALAFANSIVVAVASTILTTFLGSLAAYALAKTYLSFAFRQGLLVWILVTRIYVAYGLPFVIWLMLGFFQDLPAEIEKAAIVDGCSLWQRFQQVILPLALPGLAVTSVFAFIYSWNELLYASILTSFNAKTIPVVVAGFISDQFLRWGEMTAIGSIMIIPVLLFAAGAQRYLVRGLTFG